MPKLTTQQKLMLFYSSGLLLGVISWAGGLGILIAMGICYFFAPNK